MTEHVFAVPSADSDPFAQFRRYEVISVAENQEEVHGEIGPGGDEVIANQKWTEAYVGEWVPHDATLAGRFVDATHICFAESDMAGM